MAEGARCVAITGVDSFFGSRLADRLLSRSGGPRVVGLDLREALSLAGRTRFYPVDLSTPGADRQVAQVLEREGVDTLVHLAMRSSPTADIDSDHELETTGSRHLLNAASAAKLRRLVLVSSTMVYGARPDNPNFLEESHPLRAESAAHGVANRLELEAMAAAWRVRHPDTELCVLRPCWVFGPNYRNYVVRYFEAQIVPTVLGFDPLLQLLHEDDLLRALEKASLESHPGVWNIVGDGVLPLSTLLALGGKRSLPLPSRVLHAFARIPVEVSWGDSPEAFYDYLRYLWVAAGERGWAAFGAPTYSTKEAWISFVSARRMQDYR